MTAIRATKENATQNAAKEVELCDIEHREVLLCCAGKRVREAYIPTLRRRVIRQYNGDWSSRGDVRME
jgi:hypothetical protein